MPELPELDYYAAQLTTKLGGRVLESCTWRPTKRTNVPVDTLREALMGKTFGRATRVGKEVILEFDPDERLSVHLMLNGYFVIAEGGEAPKFTRAALEFSGPCSAYVCDPRGLVVFTLDPEPSRVPDALSPDLTPDYLAERFASAKSECVKATLMNQSIIGGIGSAYVDEILWRSRVAPQSQSSQVPPEVVAALVASIRDVLTEAIDRVAAEAEGRELDGYQPLRSFLQIHNPERTHSPTGRPIETSKVAGRTTYFTDEQVLYAAD